MNGKAFVSPGDEEATSFHLLSPQDGRTVLIETELDTFQGRADLRVRYGSADSERIATVRRRARWGKARKTQCEDFGDRP